MSTRTRILTTALALPLGLLVAMPAAAQQRGYRTYRSPQEVRVRIGSFDPSGDSAYWRDREANFTGSTSDFEDVMLGAEYLRAFGPHASLALGATGWAPETDAAYLDFEDQFGNDIVHTARLDVSSVTAGVDFFFTDADTVLRPYVGAGVGIWVWTLEETGDFIDFSTTVPEIFTATFNDEGTAFGWYWRAGLEARLTDAFSVFAEGRWDEADDSLGSDFSGLGDIDLSGTQLTGGLAWRF